VSVLVGLFLLLNKMLSKPNSKKPIECGSHSFGSGKNKIEFICYRIAILFVVFEVEIVMLFPYLIY
jgi:NADH:ubiquinone oxidoreductase subunit 3 (subunit A)